MSRRKHRIEAVAGWVLALALGGGFVVWGGAKLLGLGSQVAAFQGWGFPPWMLYLVGAVEVGAGLLLLGRNSAPYAASLLMGTMVGAVATHAGHGEMQRVALPIALLLLLGLVGWLRRPPFLRRAEPEGLTPSRQSR